MPKQKRIIVTSALPYANGPVHIGHLVEYIQTDIFVRFLKLIGKDVVYCCADDTHGTPVEIAAMKEGILPEELIGKFHQEHLRDFTSFHINFDSYSSTNSEENRHFADMLFSRLKKNGHIYKKDVELTYCNKCKRFLPDRYVRGRCPKCNSDDQYGDVCENCNAAYTTTDIIEPYCSICGSSPVRKSSKHYFFRLSAFSSKLEEWLTKNKKLQPEIVNYIMGWIKQGLEDWDISRDGPYFGFKMPDEENMYYYVWLDAPIGYISSFANALGDVKKAEKEWGNSEIIHFIGKDIIYFHFLFWPAMLMASGMGMPSHIIVHGFLTVNGEKMSKSRGTFYTAEEFGNKYPPEHLRYYYAKSLSKKMSDIDLSMKDFVKDINNELVANLANFCYRVMSFLKANFSGRITGIDENKKLIDGIKSKIKRIEECYNDVNLNEALREIMAISSLGNKYFQENEPWKMVKEDRAKAHKLLGLCINIVKNLSILISPILPDFSSKIQEQLGVEGLKWKDLDSTLKSHEINDAKIVIEKIEEKAEAEFPLNIKVGKITDVADHPDADKLYVVQVDLGEEKRQLVAGLKAHYKKEELNGKKILVLTNLKPAKLRGVMSQGMMLAADEKDKVTFLTASKSKEGSSVSVPGLKNGAKEISYDEFSKITLKTKDGKVVFEGKFLKTDAEDVLAPSVKDGTRIK